MPVPLLLLTGAGAVLAASFSPLVEARYVMPLLNTPEARVDLKQKMMFMLEGKVVRKALAFSA